MMPAGAAESRGKQKSVLAGVVYEKVPPSFLDSTLFLQSSNLYGNSRMSSSKDSHTCNTRRVLLSFFQPDFAYMSCTFVPSFIASKIFCRRPVRS